ncbi:MAG TPA: hypothetical protein VK722_13065 [Candidatus Aquilonibacter sp.]|jgi:hypothetical protein|nr:hypothetical protein [Candidatus Aquilonibacter sp.]
MARLAILGWGSLLWDPRGLKIKEPWNKDGPFLPIEFARTSGTQTPSLQPYLSLVLYPMEEKVQTYWTLSLLTNLKDARENLRERENCPLDRIAYLPVRNGHVWSPVNDVDKIISTWLCQKEKDIDMVMWTNLSWKIESRVTFSQADAISWLASLHQKKHHQRAEEYVRKAPSQTDTPTRRELRQRFGWIDINIGY